MLKNITKYFKNFVMTKSETIEEFYANRPFLQSTDFSKDRHHFNIFEIDKQKQMENNTAVSFGRKNYFKICLISGNSKIHYADKSFEILEHGLLFAHPLIPYDWEAISGQQTGYSCIFDESFTEGFGNIKKYPFFQPGGYPVFELGQEEKTMLEILINPLRKLHVKQHRN